MLRVGLFCCESEGPLLLLIKPFSSQGPNVVNGGGIINGSRHLNFCLTVNELPNGSSQDLATASLGQALDENDTLETGDGTDIMAHLLVDLTDEFLAGSGIQPLGSVLALEDHECDGAVASYLIIVADDGAFHDARVLINHLLKAAGGKSMPRSIDYIIHTGHDVKVVTLVKEARIPCGVVAWGV